MTPQPGILAQGNAHAYFMIFKVPGQAERTAIVKAVHQVQPSAGVVADLDPGAKLVINVGIGSELWDRVSPGSRPANLRAFHAVQVGGRSAPVTGGDIFLHIASARHDLNFELAMRLARLLGPVATLSEEVHGFRYLDTRDLTGFIDGTENPKGEDRAAAALIGSEDPPFAGGSYVAVQRYVHDLEKWRRLEIHEQEQIIGRTKPESVQLSDSVKPATAHISRVAIQQNGQELQILRHSYPYGTVREAGLFFVAYMKSLHTFDRMLQRMMGAAEDGLHDRLMEFSQARTGATFFVPSLETLGSLTT